MARERFNVKNIDEDAASVERFSSKRKQNHTRRDRQENPETLKKNKPFRTFIRESKHGYPTE
ncbi:hypothetical protein [Xanthomonas phage DES1]|nr:hypothetical protein [Xanthomonas phage DES1]